MRHIILYSTDSGRPYLRNELLMHIVTNSKAPLNHFIMTARMKYPEFKARYAGEEALPDAGEGEVVIRTRIDEEGRAEVTSVEESGEIDHAALRELNSRRLNIDYDSFTFRKFAEAVHKHLLPHVKDFKVFMTVRGYHLRASPRQQLSFMEKIQLRRHVDDPERIKYDQLLASLGFESLTDTLFHRKVFFSDATEAYNSYEEINPVMIKTLELSDPVLDSEFNLSIGRVGFRTEKRGQLLSASIAEFNPPVLAEDLIKHYDLFEEALIQASIPIKLCRFYERIHWRLPELIMRLADEGKIRVYRDRVEIDAGEFAGRLIGRGCQWVAQIQKELGIKLVIRGDEEHEERRMRLRKLDVLKDELLGHEGTNSPFSGAGT